MRAVDLQQSICEQVGAAVIYDEQPGSLTWLHHARLSLMPGWLDVDLQDLDRTFAEAEEAGIDVDDAFLLVCETNFWLHGHRWRLGSVVHAAVLADSALEAWRANHRFDTSDAALTMWAWLVGALIDVG